ncbi:MAG: hypothetical protein HYX25_00070 [Candidatus Solibacter usitatus]|nr:hypothetical protein [Candidatus Solibacter usitatus]
MLHITNGESVIEGFRHGGLPGVYLSWIDVLHEGPVPLCSTLEELSRIRARFIADIGWETYEKALAGFAARDRVLQSFRKHEEVVLWFEHDLFDQLQLMQLLDWFAGHDAGSTRLSLIQAGTYLGRLNGAELLALLPSRKDITTQQLTLGRQAWNALCAPDPGALAGMAAQDLAALPYLGSALRRFLEEYPSTRDGLSRTEQQLLRAAATGREKREQIFFAACESENAVFMGDSSAYLRLDRLVDGPAPALELLPGDAYRITDQGRKLLAGEADWIRERGGIDLWLSGVHLHGADAAWRWDADRQALRAS